MVVGESLIGTLMDNIDPHQYAEKVSDERNVFVAFTDPPIVVTGGGDGLAAVEVCGTRSCYCYGRNFDDPIHRLEAVGRLLRQSPDHEQVFEFTQDGTQLGADIYIREIIHNNTTVKTEVLKEINAEITV